MKNLICVLMAIIVGCAGAPVHSQTEVPPTAEPDLRTDREVAPILINLLDEKKFQKPNPNDFQAGSLREIVTLTTPAGYRLKNRYLELGVPLSHALSYARDNQLRQRLLEAARWTHSPRVRSEALLALATARDPDHLKFFREALLDPAVPIQFAAIEALQVWGYPEAMELLLKMANSTWSPLIRVYSAQAVLRMGDPRGRGKLIEFLRDGNWFVRAMAARYLGEMGNPEQDADLLMSRIGPEQGNKFVLAEICIAALNLSARKPKKPSRRKPTETEPPAPASQPPRPRSAFELEPLVITAPRSRMPPMQFVDVRIDNSLSQLLEKLADEPPPDQQIVDPVLNELNGLITPSGFSLKVRYSDLSFLVTEGLAGSRNFNLVQKLETIARQNPSPRVRASALVALAYDKSRSDIFIFRDALRDTNVMVRFGAVEALDILSGFQVRSALAEAAQSDQSRVVRVYAAQAMKRAGDPYGREMLVRFTDDQDWIVRSMAIYFLGELGEKDEYSRIGFKLNNESNPFAAAEACLALLRLAN